MLTLRLSPNLEDRLTKFAQETGRSKAAIAREAIAGRIGDLERIYLPKTRSRRKKSPRD